MRFQDVRVIAIHGGRHETLYVYQGQQTAVGAAFAVANDLARLFPDQSFGSLARVSIMADGMLVRDIYPVNTTPEVRAFSFAAQLIDGLGVVL